MDNLDTEWSLAPWAFDRVVEKLRFPNVDLFASAEHIKCGAYCTWHRDPHAIYFDAFTCRWEDGFYAFPPFALILKVLK